ncbi:MAG TPA: hypothetical protein PKU97_07200 [Kofleriaceae bacterium]|nr:hypothetical protein [Kofleriaceae bacterium]
MFDQQKLQNTREEDLQVVAASPQTGAQTQSQGPQSVPPVADLQTAQETQAATAKQSEGAPLEEKPLESFDVLVEQMAHGMAYNLDLTERDHKFLEVNGYRAAGIFRGKREFVMRYFEPIQAGKPPVVAFRGTVPTKIPTLIADLDPGSIGGYQFGANINEIKGVMERAAGHGPAVVTGHSLGGALAQLAASTFPDLVGSIITFQAPGVDRSVVEQLEKYNEENPDKAISSRHHRVAGDLVPLGGQALTPGSVHNHEMEGGNPLSKHLAYPLAQEHEAAGNGQLNYHSSEVITSTGDISTEVVNAEKTQIVEWIRKGIGVPVYAGMEVGNAVIEGGKKIIGFMTNAGRFIGRIFGGGDQDQEQDQEQTGN